MRELTLDKKIYDKCNQALMVSGSSRSGTTILGKIIHTFQDVEYAFEPPMLYSLFALLPVLPATHWKILYETYLYEVFLMNALAGRTLNCNRIDDSSIYNVKSELLIEKRLNTSLRKADAELMAKKNRIVYKMPDVVPFLPKLKRYYPGTLIVVMTRKAPEVFNSVMEKAWFTNQSLREENLIWPNRFINGLKIPFWVDPKDDEQWYDMDELHRIAYYYVRVNQSINHIPRCFTLKYDDLIANPIATVRSLSERFGFTWGDKTDEIMNTVRRTKKGRNYEILNQLNSEIREQVEYYSNKS